MTECIVLIPDNETQCAAKDKAEHQAVGTAGAELAPSAQARTVRRDGGELRITEGPYAEGVEQLSGFYLIESSDHDDMLQVDARGSAAIVALEPR